MYDEKAELIDKIDQSEDITSAIGFDQNQIVISLGSNEIVYYDIKFKKQKRKIQVLSKVKSQILDIQLHKRGSEKSLVKL